MATGQELAQYYVQIIPSAKGIGKNIVSAIEKDDPGTQAGNNIGAKIKSAIAKIGIGTAVVSTIKEALNAGGQLEQSIGGIEQIFGVGSEATEQLKKNAQEAFQYAQVNANDYMQQVTSFSARLMQGLGGDTDATVKYADMAIRQMSDNANTFGTDIGSIQAAYQGFSRANWTMLDNLRLGYGGTASEMARLVNDSGVMGKNFKATANNINQVSFDKIIEAIQVVQDNMNITGKTAAEASTTLQGSFASLKSSWTNLLADITIGEDVSTAMSGLTSSLMAVAGNVVNAIVNIVKTLPTALWEILNQLVPMVMQKGTEIMQNLTKGMEGKIPELIKSAGSAISGFISELGKNAKPLIQAGGELLNSLVKGITDSIPNIMDAAFEVLVACGDAIVDNLPIILEAGINLVFTLAQGIWQAVPTVIAKIGEMVTSMKTKIGETNWKQVGIDLLNKIIEGIKSLIGTMLGVFGQLASDALAKITNTNWFKAGADLIANITKGISNGVGSVLSTVGSLAQSIWNKITGFDWFGLGSNISKGVGSGINSSSGVAVGAAQAMASSAYVGAKRRLEVKSPSRLFAELGRFVDLGLAEGIEDNIQPIQKALDSMYTPFEEVVVDSAKLITPKQPPVIQPQPMSTNYGGVNINVYARDGQDARAIAEEVSDILANQVAMRKAVYE